jgi:hypothetical protein
MQFENDETRFLGQAKASDQCRTPCEEDGRQEPSNVVAVQLDVVRCEIPVFWLPIKPLAQKTQARPRTPEVAPAQERDEQGDV